MIVEPVTLPPDALVGDALELMARYRVSGVPITDSDGVLVGILTNRDLRFGADPTHTVASVMTSRDLVTAPLGTTLCARRRRSSAATRSRSSRSSTRRPPRGLITVKDIEKRVKYPLATKDERGRLRVVAAVGVGPTRSSGPRRSSTPTSTRSSSTPRTATRAACVEWCAPIKDAFDIEVIAGNIATAGAAEALIDAGADALKVGQGRARSARPASSPAWACRR